MGKLEFGIWDSFPAHEMGKSPVAADVYDQHLYEVQMTELWGPSCAKRGLIPIENLFEVILTETVHHIGPRERHTTERRTP